MAIIFSAVIEKFAQQGEKTGWTYIKVPQKISEKIKPGMKRSFRVKGKIDGTVVKGLAMIPFGEGNFIIAVNAAIRKEIHKQCGAKVELTLEEDKSQYKLFPALIECLRDEPMASRHFHSMPPSHQRYYSKWIEQAKTDATRIKRISMTVDAMKKKIGFGEMLRQTRI